MGLAATLLDSADGEHFHDLRNFFLPPAPSVNPLPIRTTVVTLITDADTASAVASPKQNTHSVYDMHVTTGQGPLSNKHCR